MSLNIKETKNNIIENEISYDLKCNSDNFKDLEVANQYSFLKRVTKFQKAKLLLKLTVEQQKELKKFSNKFKQDLNLNKQDFQEENAFEVRDFNLWYNNGDKQALFDINIDIKKNKVTALIGPSGCGKSTFLKNLNKMNEMIPGLVSEGNIWFNGENIYSKKLNLMELRTKVGMIFQKPTPFNMSIYDNIAFGPRNHGIKNKEKLDEIVESSLKSAALWEEVKNDLTAFGTSLSGGQQQRLCIARTIALQPEVLLMDEPTSALDPIATSKIEQLIKQLSKKVTIIIVTHSMAQAQRVSDNTAFFFKGELIEYTSTKKLFTRPKKDQTRHYLNGDEN